MLLGVVAGAGARVVKTEQAWAPPSGQLLRSRTAPRNPRHSGLMKAGGDRDFVFELGSSSSAPMVHHCTSYCVGPCGVWEPCRLQVEWVAGGRRQDWAACRRGAGTRRAA